MQVGQVEDGPVVTANHVYLIPPGKFLSITDGRLHLSQMEGPRGIPVVIDYFFRSLAKSEGERSVGIVLSGTGSDGTLGVKAIKESGGLVLAQDPQTAEFSGMPDSAIKSGVVDQILSPEEMPQALVRFAQHPYMRHSDASGEDGVASHSPPALDSADSQELAQIISLLRESGASDFRNYKEATLLRRTRRRMCLLYIDSIADYARLLRQNSGEVDALAKDLLISVTSFFRDQEAWDELAELVIPDIVSSKSNEDAVRVWIAGCATGEEAYTVAMLMMEELSAQHKTCILQVFASDVDKTALDEARAGGYPLSIASDVSPERLKRFFTQVDGEPRYRVNKTLREAVIFADQNLLVDPPYSRLDLVCCRNVLIYLKPDVQLKIIALFHFALRRDGYLMLGTAETVGRQLDLFDDVSKRWRIYRSIGETPQDRLELPIPRGITRRAVQALPPPRHDIRLTNMAQQRLVDMVAPRAVLIDRHWRILFINGNVDPYIRFQQGVPNNDLLGKLRDGLRSRLRSAVRKALNEKSTVRVTCRADRESGHHGVIVEVRIVRDAERREDFALIIFDDAQAQIIDESTDAEVLASDLDEATVIAQLEQELTATREDLQATIEQFEDTNEEFKASNEEVMSINKELQSTNEELETSKEELQSLNEELSTVNHQLAAKIEELEIKHADLENLISATEVATLCLDRDGVIRWFTP